MPLTRPSEPCYVLIRLLLGIVLVGYCEGVSVVSTTALNRMKTQYLRVVVIFTQSIRYLPKGKQPMRLLVLAATTWGGLCISMGAAWDLVGCVPFRIDLTTRYEPMSCVTNGNKKETTAFPIFLPLHSHQDWPCISHLPTETKKKQKKTKPVCWRRPVCACILPWRGCPPTVPLLYDDAES